MLGVSVFNNCGLLWGGGELVQLAPFLSLGEVG